MIELSNIVSQSKQQIICLHRMCNITNEWNFDKTIKRDTVDRLPRI